MHSVSFGDVKAETDRRAPPKPGDWGANPLAYPSQLRPVLDSNIREISVPKKDEGSV